jgi:hypothetical protein
LLIVKAKVVLLAPAKIASGVVGYFVPSHVPVMLRHADQIDQYGGPIGISKLEYYLLADNARLNFRSRVKEIYA